MEGKAQPLGLLVSISPWFAIHAKMPSFLGLKCLGKLCSSEKSRVSSSERASSTGSYRRRLVVEDVSIPGIPPPAHRRATITHLLYLPPEAYCTLEHLFNCLDPPGK